MGRTTGELAKDPRLKGAQIKKQSKLFIHKLSIEDTSRTKPSGIFAVPWTSIFKIAPPPLTHVTTRGWLHKTLNYHRTTQKVVK